MCFSTVWLGGLYVLTLRWVHRQPFKCSILYLFKTPPSCFKKTAPNFVFIQNAPPPHFSKNAVTITKEPIKWPYSVFIQNAPLLLSKNELTTRKEPTEWPNFVFIQNDPLLLHNSSTKSCIYSKRPPPTSRKAVTTTMEHMRWPNCVFIQNAPFLLQQKRGSELLDCVF